MAKITTILIGVLLLISSAHAQKMYKWTDDHGNVFYQDQPPPGAVGTVEAYAEDPELIDANDLDAASDAVNKYPVTLFSIPVCDACDLVRNMLQRHGVPFTEKDANDDPAVQNELIKLSGQLSVPLLSVGKKVIYGYNSVAIENELDKAGYLGNEPRTSEAEAEETASLSADEVEEQAALAGAEFASELEELEQSDLGEEEIVEEIPEDEQIKVGGAQ